MFRLNGARRLEQLSVYATPGDADAATTFIAPPPGVPVVVRIDRQAEPTFRFDVTLKSRSPAKYKPSGVAVYAFRRTDGFTALGWSQSNGSASLGLPVGRWELVVGGEVGPYVQRRMSINVKATGKNEIEVPVDMWPEVRVVGTNAKDRAPISLSSAHDQRWIWAEGEPSVLVRIPRDRDVALRVSPGWNTVSGDPGCVVNIEQGADLSRGIRVVPPSNPRRGDWLVDGEEPELEAEPEPRGVVLTILDENGQPVAGAWVRTGFGRSERQYNTDKNGQAEVGSAAAHVEVRAKREAGRWAPLHAPLNGPGPWTLQFGKSSVRIEARNTRGERVTWRGLLPGGDVAWGVDEDAELFGLKPGLHRILVSGLDERGVVRQFRLTESSTRLIRIVLPDR